MFNVGQALLKREVDLPELQTFDACSDGVIYYVT